MWAARMSQYATDELTLAQDVVPRLRKGMLCLADRFFPSYKLWQAAAQTGADLLWRTRQNARLDVDRRLPDILRGLALNRQVEYLDHTPTHRRFARTGTGRTRRSQLCAVALVSPQQAPDGALHTSHWRTDGPREGAARWQGR